MSRGVTGEVHHVDSGYHVLGMKRLDAPAISFGNSARNNCIRHCERSEAIHCGKNWIASSLRSSQ